jgi:hypothetical protein
MFGKKVRQKGANLPEHYRIIDDKRGFAGESRDFLLVNHAGPGQYLPDTVLFFHQYSTFDFRTGISG